MEPQWNGLWVGFALVLGAMACAGAAEESLVDRAWVEGMNRASTAQLYYRAMKSFQGKRFEEAATTIQLAELRYAIDREAYPIDQDRESKRADVSFAVTSSIASRTYPDIILSADRLAKLIEVIHRYQPLFDPDYRPGWISSQRPEQARFQAIATAMKNKWLKQLKVMENLQADAEYMRLAKAYYRSELFDASLPKQVQHGEPAGLRLGKKDAERLREQMTEVARKVDPMLKAWVPAPFLWLDPESP